MGLTLGLMHDELIVLRLPDGRDISLRRVSSSYATPRIKIEAPDDVHIERVKLGEQPSRDGGKDVADD